MNVLVVSAPRTSLKSLQLRLEAAGHTVGHTIGVSHARAWFERLGPDAVVVDLRGQDGADLVREWREQAPLLPLIVFGGARSEHLKGMAAGATDFLTAPFDDDDVLHCLDTWTHPIVELGDTLQLTDRTVDLKRRVVVRDGQECRLSPNEVKLLSFLAQRPNRPFTRQQLLSRVWGYHPGVISRTVATTMARLRAKVEREPSVPVHLLRVEGIGYRFAPVSSPGFDAPQTRPLAERGPFVGRQAELARVREQLKSRRVVTLTGPAGVGKSRIVRHLLPTIREDGSEVVVCPLGGVARPEALCRAVARALSVTLQHKDPIGGLEQLLADREDLILVLDNAESLDTESRAILERWVQGAPTFLVTSRMALRLPGEQTIPIAPLPLEGEVGAIGLFLGLARSVQPAFAPEGAQDPHVRSIVQALDCLPLALELAAERAALFSPQQLLKRLEDRALLRSRDPQIDPRHASLKAVLDEALSQLTPSEESALLQCTVFPGSFSVDAAEEVVDLSHRAGALPVLEVLHGLVEQGLLQPDQLEQQDDTLRLGMLRSVRSVLTQRPAMDSVIADAHARHGRFFGDLANEALEDLNERGCTATFQLLLAETDNLVVATERAIASDRPEMASACCRGASKALRHAGQVQTGIDLSERVLQMASLLEPAQQRILQSRAGLFLLVGAVTSARADLDRARGLACAKASDLLMLEATIAHRDQQRSEAARLYADVLAHCGPDQAFRAARAQTNLATLLLEMGKPDEAEAHLLRALDRFIETGAHALEGWALNGLASVRCRQDRLYEARELFERAIELHRRTGSQMREAIAASNLASVLGALKDPEEWTDARLELFGRAISIHRQMGNRRSLGISLLGLGQLELECGKAKAAKTTFGRAHLVCIRLGDPQLLGLSQALLGQALGRLGETDAAKEHLATARDLLEKTEDQGPSQLTGELADLVKTVDAELHQRR
jgi:DNA-binding response OmpR family regulator/tetratricopeptide (TPR) repeat protein